MGVIFTTRQASAMCRNPDEGHQWYTTRDNMLGGATKNMHREAINREVIKAVRSLEEVMVVTNHLSRFLIQKRDSTT